ncbi:probable helicase with zinc finger domain [Dendronephthya gigantea]|uniref:probable helicase with zinc finger domain n=1 Tax=Dendronephthya gigantea TaxID=151771 RepID=UPI00106A3BAA|nr:probable helicase with zinc finger domain [Dendronephthya gigantea]
MAESFGEKVRRRVKQEGLCQVLKQNLLGVTLTCSSERQLKLVKIDGGQVEHTWIFEVRIQRKYQLLLSEVAFLLETHLDKFKLLCRSSGRQKQPPDWHNARFVEEDFVESVAENESAVQFRVQFASGVFGDFEQKLVFGFGSDDVLVYSLIVSVVSKDSSKEETSSRTRYCRIAEWSVDKMELVRCKELMGMDLNGLCERYSIPDDLPVPSECSDLSRETYCNTWHKILFIEEQHIQTEVSRYDIQDGVMKVVKYSKLTKERSFANAVSGELFGEIVLSDHLIMDEVAGHIINRSVTSVILRPKKRKSSRKKVYECIIKSKTSKSVVIQLNKELCKDFSLTKDQKVEIDLKFRYNRLPLCEMHEAVDMCKHKTDILLPNVKNVSYKFKKSIPDWYLDQKPNTNQHEAIAMILDPNPTPPILVIGPFGTGKTFTLSLACVAILSQSESNKVLICTHSNTAADIHLGHLDKKIQDQKTSLSIRPLRVLNLSRNVMDVPEKLRKYCNIKEESNDTRELTANDIHDNNVIITTLSVARVLWKFCQNNELRFTHILVDQVTQALEPECLAPLAMADGKTKIVLAGDHKQMGPRVYSKSIWTKRFGPRISLLERLFAHYEQCKQTSNERDRNFDGIPYVVLLSENYRSHAKILEFPSYNFYGGMLVARGDQSTHEVVPVLSFYTAQGVDRKVEGGLAYYNDAEVDEVVARVKKLDVLWPEGWPRKIGVITPYFDQVKRIRDILSKEGLDYVDVETVENVQGKQFKALFISTVRTMWTCSLIEGRNSDPSELDFGFLSDPRFLNTAVTRAQSLLAVVGDPMSLCSVGACRDLWKDYLKRCEKNKGLHGCTLKTVMDYCLRSQPLDPSAHEFISSSSKR